MSDNPNFNVGDTVSWESQAGGKWVKKTGKIVGVVPPGAAPAKYCPKDLIPPRAEGKRIRQSYVVYVKELGRRTYWPKEGVLKLVICGSIPQNIAKAPKKKAEKKPVVIVPRDIQKPVAAEKKAVEKKEAKPVFPKAPPPPPSPVFVGIENIKFADDAKFGEWTACIKGYPRVSLVNGFWEHITVLVYQGGKYNPCCTARFTMSGGDRCDSGLEIKPCFKTDDGIRISRATHWMPLPPPPADVPVIAEAHVEAIVKLEELEAKEDAESIEDLEVEVPEDTEVVFTE